MSVLIKGMEMPEKCGDCPFFGLQSAGNGMYYDYCNAYRGLVYDADNSVSMYCPLVEVPTPHGRLIDADAIPFVQSEDGCTDDYAYRYDINELPTVIEAEGPKE